MAPSLECTLKPTENAKAIIPAKGENGEAVLNWEQVSHFVSTNQIKNIHRSKKMETIYQQWRNETLTKYKTIENYLLSEKLRFLSKDSRESSQEPHVIILPNDFPYSVEPNIHHIVIWSQNPLEKQSVENELEDKYGSKTWQWIYFVNPPEKQSVRKLPHVQVFIRRRELQKNTDTQSAY